jgi:UPF0716 protein FxsA
VAFLALEMVGIYRIAQDIGWGGTLLWLLAAGIAGVAVIRRAGSGFLTAMLASAQAGQAPIAVVWSTGRRFLAGTLLIFPGIFSDLIGLLLLLWPGTRLPPSRPSGRDDDVIEGEFRREEELVERIPAGKEP